MKKLNSEEKTQKRKEYLKEYSKKYYQNNKEKILMYQKEYDKKYKKERKLYNKRHMKEYYQTHEEERKTYSKIYHKNHKEKRTNYYKIYFKNYFNNRLKTDINFKLASRLRDRLRKAIKGNQKSGSAVQDLGCSIPELKTYLESKFQEGMSWENWGMYGWHIDHIKPLSSFNLQNREEFLEACNYINLQPLWAEENLRKH